MTSLHVLWACVKLSIYHILLSVVTYHISSILKIFLFAFSTAQPINQSQQGTEGHELLISHTNRTGSHQPLLLCVLIKREWMDSMLCCVLCWGTENAESRWICFAHVWIMCCIQCCLALLFSSFLWWKYFSNVKSKPGNRCNLIQ